jgi:SAM-dependent methyltransferase
VIGVERVESDYYQFMEFDPANARSGLSYYLQFFKIGPVLELASGPGVFLTLLTEAGVAASGVDIDDGMVAQTREAGHEVVLGDAIEHLQGLAAESLAGLFAAHFLEHLPSVAAQQVYTEAARVLKPGGRFVAVVPNAACLSILGYDFWRDPTHVRFYDPIALEFFARQAGLIVTSSGGNPNNHPGPPPHLLAPLGESVSPLQQDVASLIAQAGEAIETRNGSQRVQMPRAARSQAADQQLWAELGRVLSVMEHNNQLLHHELGLLRTAYGNLLKQLYPANEVYVVVEKPTHSDESNRG